MKNLLYFLAFPLLVGCSQPSSTSNVEKVSFVQEWFPNANYAGELFAMEKFDEQNGIDLEVISGSYDIDPIKMVLNKSYDFGIVSADRLIEANDKGANLVAIAVANFKSPTCFITKKGMEFNKLSDFKGKRVGILTGTNTELIYSLLKEKGNMSNDEVEEIEVPFDLGTFLLGEYDVRPAFAYDEPVSLEQKGIEYNILYPEDFGVTFLGTIYFCRAELITQNPALVKGFVKSILLGWKEAFKEPEGAIALLKKYDPQCDKERELKSLEKALPYFQGENANLLFASENTWTETANVLIKKERIKLFDFNSSVDYSFLDE